MSASVEATKQLRSEQPEQNLSRMLNSDQHLKKIILKLDLFLSAPPSVTNDLLALLSPQGQDKHTCTAFSDSCSFHFSCTILHLESQWTKAPGKL